MLRCHIYVTTCHIIWFIISIYHFKIILQVKHIPWQIRFFCAFGHIGEGSGGMNRRGFCWQPLESQVKLSVEEVRRDDLNLDNLRKGGTGGTRWQIRSSEYQLGVVIEPWLISQSLTTRAGDLIEFIFAKESMLRLVKWWKKSWGFQRFNWALYLLTLDIPKIYYLTMKIWGGSVIEKNENRSAVNVGDSDEFAAAKMFQHQWWMDSDGQLTLGNFKWNDFQKKQHFPIIFRRYVFSHLFHFREEETCTEGCPADSAQEHHKS